MEKRCGEAVNQALTQNTGGLPRTFVAAEILS